MTTPSDAVDNEPGQSDPADMELARERIAVLEQRVDEYRKRELVLYRLEKTVETMQLGVTVTDLQGKIVYVNPADAAMHGYEPAALIGQDARVFAAGELGAPLEPGRLADMKSWRREGINVCKDGTEFPVQLMSDVVRDALGDPIGVVTTCEDITDRKRTEEALRASEERYALAAAGASVGLWDWDLESMTVFYSERWKQMLGHEQSDIGTKPDEWWDRIHPDDRERVEAEIQSVTQLESVFEHYESEHRIKHEDGSYRWFLCRGVVVRDERGRAVRMVGSKNDITERKRVEQQLLEDAFHDFLTGLPNRSLFRNMVERCIGRARRKEDYCFAVMVLNLDRFKIVNDSLGHAIGDKLLVSISRRLKDCLRPSDAIARFDGDRFGILLDDMRDVSDPHRVSNRIHEQFTKPFHVDAREVFMSASIGIAVSTTGYDEADELIRDADTALHRSKLGGLGRHEVFDSVMREQAVERLQLETDLRGAVERAELRTHYQPIVLLRDGVLTGFEALLRWQHPRRGLLAPGAFISVAEETDLIVPIGWWILGDACSQLHAWKHDIADAREIGVSVNFSGRQLMQADALDRVRNALVDSSIDAGYLRLEMTETVMMEGGSRSTELMKQLKELPVSLYMDDFGTGYSSLSYLHAFPLDILKVDRSFVMRMNEKGKFAEIVRAIIEMAHNLGMKVVAEGVAEIEQARLLRNFGCDYAQGFYFSKPVPEAEAAELIRRRVVRAVD